MKPFEAVKSNPIKARLWAVSVEAALTFDIRDQMAQTIYALTRAEAEGQIEGWRWNSPTLAIRDGCEIPNEEARDDYLCHIIGDCGEVGPWQMTQWALMDAVRQWEASKAPLCCERPSLLSLAAQAAAPAQYIKAHTDSSSLSLMSPPEQSPHSDRAALWHFGPDWADKMDDPPGGLDAWAAYLVRFNNGLREVTR